jgi:hypothetical protein
LEHPTEPPLPAPLPRPLSDPLRIYRRLILFLVLPALWLAVVLQWLLPHVEQRTIRDTAQSLALAAAFTLLFCVFQILPRRVTNAIYLRSFRNDARTGALRTDAQAALGRAFRLSGIRDPNRRWPGLIRHLLYILFLIRYAQPKYMNLEAGHDWKARLWRSLGEARCALIDVTELTPFVREEVELAVRCLGFHRVLFVADASQTADEWRHSIGATLGAPDVQPDRITVAVWADTSAGRTAFKHHVRAFADGLPADPPGLNPAALPDNPASTDPGGNAVRGDSWWAFLLASLIGTGLTGALIWAESRTPDAGLVWFLPGLIYDALAALLLLQYFAVCGSLRERFRVGGAFLFGAVFAGLPVVLDLVTPPRETVRDIALRIQSGNNLKQIGLAMEQYEETHNRPPPLAVCRPDCTPLLSWRVLLLPHLEQQALFAEFKLDEPWDGPHNVRLLDRIPNVYRSPYAPPKGDPTGTHYQVFAGPGTLWGDRNPAGQHPRIYLPGWPATTQVAVFDPPFRLADLRKAGDTILVVEAADPVPWTKPVDLDYRPAADRAAPDEMVRRIGPTRFGFSARMADGTVRRFPNAMSPDKLDSLIALSPSHR